MVRTVLQLHKDDMQAYLEPSTTKHFVRGDKVAVVTKNLFLRGQPNKKLRDRQLGPCTIEEHIGKHIYILRLLATIRLRPIFHANNLRPCYRASLRPAVHVTTPKVTMTSSKSLTFIMCASSRYLDDEGNICSK
jgi:hypothetical protein